MSMSAAFFDQEVKKRTHAIAAQGRCYPRRSAHMLKDEPEATPASWNESQTGIAAVKHVQSECSGAPATMRPPPPWKDRDASPE